MTLRRVALLVAVTAVVALLPATAASAAARHGTPGSVGSGDPYFPRQGNGGYTVSHYRLSVRYTPASKQLRGVAHLRARATKTLSRFDLDLRRNLHVSAVFVGGHRAAYRQPKKLVQELVVTPHHALRRNHRFTVEVRYAGTAKAVIDPDGSLDGFIPTDDGAFVASEPQGAPSWYPVNDTPRDKATYTVSITVPKGLTAVSNGALTRRHVHGSLVTWSWALHRKVSSYLVTATLGKFDLQRGRTRAGIPYLIAVDPREAAKAKPVLAQLPAIVDYFSKVYGRYPFGQAGAIVDHAHKVGYALETATRPLFDRAPDIATLSHELAHQWYGDDVTVAKWRDIWLNEGFAEFSSWLYTEHTGGQSTAQHLAALLANPASDSDEWLPPPGNPGSAPGIFADSVYDRGAGTLAALRQKLGDHTFFTIMRGWLGRHRYGNATVAQFTAYAQQVAHQDLRHFFFEWLYKKGKPSGY